MAELGEITRVFWRIGLHSFGGPAAQIALMHRVLVEERGWLDEARFLSSLSFCMLLPGPEAMQLATYCGWRLQGWRGGVIAGGLFVLPGAVTIAVLALAYLAWGDQPLLIAAFQGIQAAVIAILCQALFRLAQRALQRRESWLLAGAAFLALFLFGLPFPLIILVAGGYGALFAPIPPQTPPNSPSQTARPIVTLALWAGLWAAPILLAWAMGWEFLTEIALFFSKLAIVTFGGAYAVLSYMAQTVVQDHGWISAAQMMDGLGLAETTPGPLILVTQFVAMLAGGQIGGWGLSLAAGAMALWVTFLPCYLWIFTCAPYLEKISSRPRLAGALQAVTAAVVGVILNLAIWFTFHVFFADQAPVQLLGTTLSLPQLVSLRPFVVLLAFFAGFLILSRKHAIGPVLATTAAVAAIRSLLT